MKRSAFLACAFAAASWPLVVMAQTNQTDWPNKPVTMVVPYPPGGLNDAVARIYADKMQAELGKGVLIGLHDLCRRYVADHQPDLDRQRAIRPA